MKYLFKFKCDPLSDFISIVCIHNILFSIKDALSFWMLSNLPLYVLFFQYNFVGRILGPRGLTAKQLEAETGCKIMVRGRSSMRDRKKVRHAAKHSFLKEDIDVHLLILTKTTSVKKITNTWFIRLFYIYIYIYIYIHTYIHTYIHA